MGGGAAAVRRPRRADKAPRILPIGELVGRTHQRLRLTEDPADRRLDKELVRRVIYCLLRVMRDAVVAGETIELRGFGRLGRRWLRPFRLRHPFSDEPHSVAGRWRPYFQASRVLKADIALHVEESGETDGPLAPPPAKGTLVPARSRDARRRWWKRVKGTEPPPR